MAMLCQMCVAYLVSYEVLIDRPDWDRLPLRVQVRNHILENEK